MKIIHLLQDIEQVFNKAILFNMNTESHKMLDDHGILSSEIRLLPYGSPDQGGNICVGRESYNKEINFRKERNKTVATPFPLPEWDSLKLYFKDGNIVE
jgi:hypothetical protein